MATWSIVECGFNGCDETINFGTRKFADSSKSLYETITLAAISTNDEVKSNLCIQSVTFSNKVYLVIDNSFRVFSENCSNLELYTSFDSLVDCFCVSNDERLSLLCLSDGNIHCLSLENGGKLICSTSVEAAIDCKCFISVYVESHADDSINFIIVGKTGQVFRFTIKNIIDIYSNICNEVSFDLQSLWQLECSVTCTTMNPIADVIKSTDFGLYVNSEFKTSSKCCNLVRLYDTNNMLMLGLNKAGTLVGICPVTFLTFDVWDEEKIKDIIFIENPNTSNHHLLMLTQLNDCDMYIKLMTYPEFELVYQLEVSENAIFIEPTSHQDEYLFIEGVRNGEYVDEIRVKTIMESLPEIRLKRILQRKKFNEAETFAQNTGLDMQPVWKARISHYVDQLHCADEDLDELCTLLNKITDIPFVVQCCKDVTPVNIDGLSKIYKHTNSMLQSAIMNNPMEQALWALQDTVAGTLSRLDLFLMLQPDGEVCLSEWFRFSSVDLLSELQRHLQMGHVSDSALILSRLDCGIALTASRLEQLLSAVPSNVPLLDLVPWLRALLPAVLAAASHSLMLFIDWLYQNVMACEQSDWQPWPEYGLEFARRVLELLHSDVCSKDMGLAFQQQCAASRGAFLRMSQLIDALVEIQLLKDEFKIRVSLQTYIQSSTVVVYALLDAVHLDKLPRFVDEFLMGFMIRNRLNSDEVISEHVEELACSQPPWWQETIMLLLPFLHSLGTRLETTLSVLKSAEVPWSEQMTQLADDSLKLKHPLTAKIKMEQEYTTVKMLLKKYQISGVDIYDEYEMLHVVWRILKRNLPEMMEDVEKVASNQAAIDFECKLTCLNHLILNDRNREALKFLDGMTKESMLKCCRVIMSTCKQAVSSSEVGFSYMRPAYMEIVGSVITRLKLHTPSYIHEVYDRELQTMRNMYILKKEYGYNENIFGGDKTSHLNKLIEQLQNSVKENKFSWSDACYRSERIAQLVGLDKRDGLLKLADGNKSLPELITVVESIARSDVQSTHFCMAAELLLANLCNTSPSINIDDLMLKKQTNTKIHSIVWKMERKPGEVICMMQALNLVEDLATQACQKVLEEIDVRKFNRAFDILNWSNACRYLRYEPDATMPKWKITAVFNPDTVHPPPVSTFIILKDVFRISRQIVAYPMMTCLTEDQWQVHLGHLTAKMMQLHTEGHDLTAFRLLHALKMSASISHLQPHVLARVNADLNQLMLSQCIPQILNKIVASKRVDECFAVSLLMALGKNALRWMTSMLKKYKMNVNKFQVVSVIAMRYLETCEIRNELYIACSNIRLQCDWWKKCLHSLVPYNDAFQLTPEQLLYTLMMSEKFSIKLLQEFCTDFDLSMQKYLPQYLHNILLSWQPLYEVLDIPGLQRTINIKNSDDELLKTCCEIVQLIENKSLLLNELNEVWEKVSHYRYEVYICILELLEKLECDFKSPEKKLLLLFLKGYTRISSPQQDEIENWQTLFPSSYNLDPLSEFRLPYLPAMYMKDVWKIIRPEINLSTYEQWFEVSSLLDLNRNDTCTYAIKGVIGKLNSDKWSIHSRHDNTIADISKCVAYMTDLEMATAVLYQVVYTSSGNADQVTVAHMCLAKAREWMKSNQQMESFHKVYDKVQWKYWNCSTLQILHSHQLGDELYQQLVGQTEPLIAALYQDERIIHGARSASLYCPDINRAVDEIAQLFDLDVKKIRFDLIMELLQVKTNVANLDETFANPNLCFDNTSNEINNNLKRICYICECGNKKEWIVELYNIGRNNHDAVDFNSTVLDEALPLVVRTRALHCVLALADTRTLYEVTYRNYEDFSIYLKSLEILCQLEELGLALSVDSLDRCAKPELVLNLMQSYGHNPLAIVTMADLCSQYDLYEPQFWEAILFQFTSMKMVAELRKWLPRLASRHHIVCGTAYLSAWTVLIETPFNRTKHSTKQHEEECIESILLLQTCPITSRIDLSNTCKKCVTMGKPEYAAVMLMYMKLAQRDSVIKDLMSCQDLTVKKIEALSEFGVLNTSRAVQIFNSFNASRDVH